MILFVLNRIYKRQTKASFRKFEFVVYLHNEWAMTVFRPDMPNILVINISQSLCAILCVGVLLLVDVTRSNINTCIFYIITILNL
jgi:hypothetical protein